MDTKETYWKPQTFVAVAGMHCSHQTCHGDRVSLYYSAVVYFQMQTTVSWIGSLANLREMHTSWFNHLPRAKATKIIHTKQHGITNKLWKFREKNKRKMLLWSNYISKSVMFMFSECHTHPYTASLNSAWIPCQISARSMEQKIHLWVNAIPVFVLQKSCQ